MIPLLTLTEEILFGKRVSPIPTTYRERRAARAVVFDGKQVALLHASRFDYYKLPGGGIEEGENIQEALQREMLEEVGCTVNVLQELGTIVEYRDKENLHQESICFVAEVAGSIGKPHFTEEELVEGFSVFWADSLSAAIELLKKDATSSQVYESAFMQARDLRFLQEAASTKR